MQASSMPGGSGPGQGAAAPVLGASLNLQRALGLTPKDEQDTRQRVQLCRPPPPVPQEALESSSMGLATPYVFPEIWPAIQPFPDLNLPEHGQEGQEEGGRTAAGSVEEGQASHVLDIPLDGNGKPTLFFNMCLEASTGGAATAATLPPATAATATEEEAENSSGASAGAIILPPPPPAGSDQSAHGTSRGISPPWLSCHRQFPWIVRGLAQRLFTWHRTLSSYGSLHGQVSWLPNPSESHDIRKLVFLDLSVTPPRPMIQIMAKENISISIYQSDTYETGTSPHQSQYRQGEWIWWHVCKQPIGEPGTTAAVALPIWFVFAVPKDLVTKESHFKSYPRIEEARFIAPATSMASVNTSTGGVYNGAGWTAGEPQRGSLETSSFTLTENSPKGFGAYLDHSASSANQPTNPNQHLRPSFLRTELEFACTGKMPMVDGERVNLQDMRYIADRFSRGKLCLLWWRKWDDKWNAMF